MQDSVHIPPSLINFGAASATPSISYPKEQRRYSNALWLLKLNDVSKAIYETDKRYEQWAFEHKKRQVQLASKRRLFKFCYLTADRISENILKPRPTLRLSSIGKRNVVIINRVNEKHFTSTGDRELISEVLYVNGIHEKLMWESIFPDDIIPEKEYSIDYFMVPLLNEKSIDTNRTRFAHMFNYFTADMTDGDKTYKNHPFTPHQLRHLRAYNLRFNWGYDWDLIKVWLGWDNEDMKEHYVYIRKQIKNEEQLEILKRYSGMEQHVNLDLSEYGLKSLAQR